MVTRGECTSFFFQAEDGIRDLIVTGVQTCALPISQGVQGPCGRTLRAGEEASHRLKASNRERRRRPDPATCDDSLQAGGGAGAPVVIPSCRRSRLSAEPARNQAICSLVRLCRRTIVSTAPAA